MIILLLNLIISQIITRLKILLLIRLLRILVLLIILVYLRGDRLGDII
jgi:hypothetical protein